ncbi:unnamed protein product [Triticum turgidum subsp. durum]|uniref:UspA domain-containing protein n=1 Tax=Triticum turgidum subsp. durum TaxID=4567 RepID=A0A9R0Z529_TRITD|nr:unnamed protein product [Triticum turgidum subsp. durum]
MCRYQQDDRDLEEAPSSSPRLVAVCVDSGRNSVSALKWAVEEALAGNRNSQPQPIVLVHVKKPAQPRVREILLPFRVFCARKGMLFAELGKEPPRELLHNIGTPSNMNRQQEPVTFNTLVYEQ